MQRRGYQDTRIFAWWNVVFGRSNEGIGCFPFNTNPSCSPSLVRKRAEVRCDWPKPPLRSHANLGNLREPFPRRKLDGFGGTCPGVVINSASCEGGLFAGNCNPQLPDDGKLLYRTTKLHPSHVLRSWATTTELDWLRVPFISWRSSNLGAEKMLSRIALYRIMLLFSENWSSAPGFELLWAQRTTLSRDRSLSRPLPTAIGPYLQVEYYVCKVLEKVEGWSLLKMFTKFSSYWWSIRFTRRFCFCEPCT